MSSIAFAVDSEHEDLVEGDRMLREALEDRGHSVSVEVWNRDEVKWESYDLVLVRSTWDYVQNYEDFMDWVDRLEKLDVILWNPPEVLRWNSRKTYLQDLNSSGIPIPPSVFVPAGARIPLDAVLAEKDWDDVIIKPLIGAGSHELQRFSGENPEEAQEHLDALVDRNGAVIQKFIPEVEQEGEWSFVFAGNQLSHVVLKTPSDDDFRAHRDMGGTRHQRTPPDNILGQATDYVKKITKPYLYLRLDGIVSGGRLLVLEAEMIEPRLYVETSEDGAENLAEAVHKALQEGLSVEFFESAVPSEIATGNGE